MTESIIGDELVYPQKFNRDDYYFEYFPVTLIQPQTNSDIVTEQAELDYVVGGGGIG